MSAVAEHSEDTGQYVRVTVTGAADESEAEEVAAAYVSADGSAEWVADQGAGEHEVVFRRADVRTEAFA